MTEREGVRTIKNGEADGKENERKPQRRDKKSTMQNGQKAEVSSEFGITRTL